MFKFSKLTLFCFLTPYYFLNAQSSYNNIPIKKDIEMESVFKKNSGDEERFDNLTGKPNLISLASNIDRTNERDSLRFLSGHFGYNFFNRSDTLAFFENIPAPGSYVLGPGDELIITIWGENQIRKSYTIMRDGNIYDDKLGLLSPTGLTINEAKKYLKDQFARFYSTLGSSRPTSFFSLSMGELKSINVSFVGELLNPGVYAIHPFSNLISGLIQIGGVDTTGTLRKIEIIHENNKSTTVDLYQYLIEGKKPNKIELKDQDIVKVSVRNSTVKIDSAIMRPGIYESLEGETVKDLIGYAGGPIYSASSNISINRVLPRNERTESIKEQNFYVDIENSANIKVIDGDVVVLLEMLDSENFVDLIGQVKRPGKYNFYEKMTLKNLLDLGSGFDDTTFLRSVYMDRAEIIRRNSSTKYENVIEVNLFELLQNKANDIPLNNLDRIVIHENINFFNNKNIKILGEVNVPGSYPITKRNETLQSFIQRAGGLTDDALFEGIQIFRESDIIQNNSDLLEYSEIKSKFQVAWENDEIPLFPGDSVIIKKSSRTINVQGEVYNPGIVELKNLRGINYYVKTAGGFTQNADRRDVIIIYPNGIIKPNRLFFSPKVIDGSTIVVKNKEISEPFNITQFATNWTSIISSVITAVILSKQLEN